MPCPDDRFERSLADEGFELVAGLDEVGRGAWAGPVSVGVVVFCRDSIPPEGIRDSKMLTEERREELFPQVTGWCVDPAKESRRTLVSDTVTINDARFAPPAPSDL